MACDICFGDARARPVRFVVCVDLTGVEAQQAAREIMNAIGEPVTVTDIAQPVMTKPHHVCESCLRGCVRDALDSLVGSLCMRGGHLPL